MADEGRVVDPGGHVEFRPVDDEPAAAPQIGFAISGGGSRGSFGVGALDYLTNVVHVGASVISGTSSIQPRNEVRPPKRT